MTWHLAPAPKFALDHRTCSDCTFLLGFKIGKAHDQTGDGVPILFADLALMCGDRIELRSDVRCIGCDTLFVGHCIVLHPDGDQRIGVLDGIRVRQRTRVRFVNDQQNCRIKFDDARIAPRCVGECLECAIVQCQYCLAVGCCIVPATVERDDDRGTADGRVVRYRYVRYAEV